MARYALRIGIEREQIVQLALVLRNGRVIKIGMHANFEGLRIARRERRIMARGEDRAALRMLFEQRERVLQNLRRAPVRIHSDKDFGNCVRHSCIFFYTRCGFVCSSPQRIILPRVRGLVLGRDSNFETCREH